METWRLFMVARQITAESKKGSKKYSRICLEGGRETQVHYLRTAENLILTLFG